MVVRELVAVLGLDLRKQDFQAADAAINKVKSAAKKLAVAFAGVAGIHALKETVSDVRATGDALDKLSGKLGVSTGALQELQYAAGLSGVTQRSFNLSLQRFTRRAAEAAQGTGTAKDAFAQMGIQLTDGQGRLRRTENILADVADAMARTGDSGERVRLAFKLFDRDGVGMVNMLKGGSGAVNDMRREARALGGVMSEELIGQSVALTDNLARLDAIFAAVKHTIAETVIPLVNDLIEGYVRWRREQGELLGQGITVFLRAIGRAVMAFGVTVFAVTGKITNFVTKLDTLGKSLALLLGVALALKIAIAFPFLLATAAVGLLAIAVDDLYKTLTGGDTLIGRLADSFDDFVERYSSEPINPDDHWLTKTFKCAASAIKEAEKELQALLDKFDTVPEFIRELLQPLHDRDFWRGLKEEILSWEIRQGKTFREVIAEARGQDTPRTATKQRPKSQRRKTGIPRTAAKKQNADTPRTTSTRPTAQRPPVTQRRVQQATTTQRTAAKKQNAGTPRTTATRPTARPTAAAQQRVRKREETVRDAPRAPAQLENPTAVLAQLMPAGAACPQASASISTNVHNHSVSVAPQNVTAQITVHAAPHQSSRDTAHEVMRELKTHIAAQQRAALAALTEGVSS